MGTDGIHSLTADEALNVQLGMLGFDEVDFTEHLTGGDDLDSDYWGSTEELHNNTGTPTIKITDNLETLQVSMTTGEIFSALQVLTPERNRIMTRYQTNWVNGPTNMDQFRDAGNWLWTYASAIGMGWQLPVAYAPMTAGQVYEMTLWNSGQIFNGSWEFQDYGGRELTLHADTETGTPGAAFIVDSCPTNAKYMFTAPAGTSGGFRVKALETYSNGQYWDNFELVNILATSIAVGTVFKISSGTADTSDNKLYTAKGDVAPATNDLFAVTGVGASAAVVYIGNAIGSYAFKAASTTSTLTQTAANRASAGLNAKGTASKEYALTYTVAIKQAIAPAASLAVTLETFGASTTMPITAGEHTVYFKSVSGAAAADFVIQAVASATMTAGVLAITDVSLRRCCDNETNPAGVSWWKAKAIRGAATFSATAINGDDLRSDELSEDTETDPGIFSRIEGTAGIIRAYRVPHRISDV